MELHRILNLNSQVQLLQLTTTTQSFQNDSTLIFVLNLCYNDQRGDILITCTIPSSRPLSSVPDAFICEVRPLDVQIGTSSGY